MNPVPINMLQQQLLLAFRYWVVNRQRLGIPVDADEFTAITAFEQSQLMVHIQEDDAIADKEMVAKMPDKFKQSSQWRVFAEMIETYLSQLKGSGRVPLNYIIRKLAAPIPEAAYETDAEQAVAIAPLVGEQYNRDNNKVYGILKQLCLEGPGRSYILQFDRNKDGRGAWLAMHSHFEGESYRNRAKLEAYATLANIHYDGERKSFTFETFIEKHNQCFLELSRQNEPVHEDKKVRDFLDRINASELQAAKQAVRTSEAMVGNFQLAANFVALSVAPAKSSTRFIASAQTDRSSQQGRGGGHRSGRGHGQSNDHKQSGGCGRGGTGHQGHGGRGGRGKSNTKLGYYSYEEWCALSREQRDSILEVRGTKRNVSEIKIKANKADKDVTANSDDASNAANSGGAGDEFGRKRGKRANQYIGMFRSTLRKTCNYDTMNRIVAKATSHQRDVEVGKFLDLDSHADTSVIGANCRIISFTNKSCQVATYHPDYPAMNDVPIVQAGAAYDDPDTGETIILVINQGLYLGDSLPNSLINPNQM